MKLDRDRIRQSGGYALSREARARLRARRDELDLPAKVVSARIGVAPNTLWSWETGQREPGFASVVAWARALGMKLELREGP